MLSGEQANTGDVSLVQCSVVVVFLTKYATDLQLKPQVDSSEGKLPAGWQF